MESSFFKEAREQSQVKAAIISKYFWSWANVFKRQVDKIAYVDLFAGPGRYDDGTKSTPLLILEQAIADPLFRTKLVTLFNDGDPENAASLKTEIARLPGIESLTYAPNIDNQLVGEAIASELQAIKLVPTLCFIDPFGYKGLSLGLVNSVLKDFGCECIFFFNYNRINMGVTNDFVRGHMEALFGVDRILDLRERLAGLTPHDREFAVVEELTQALKEMGGKYVLPFRFRNAAGTRTSHHLIFVSKSELGYRIMKTVMANESSQHDQGVPSFEYSAADARFPTLFELTRPLEALQTMLLADFSGRSLTVRELITEHHINRPFIDPNYKDALKILEANGSIVTKPAAGFRVKRNGIVTLADSVLVSFPRRT